MIKVEGYSYLYRDEKTGSIINTDTSGYRSRLKSIQSSDKQENELKKMRVDIDELKDLLKTFLKSTK